ncbi:protease inhibitor I42 family protein [Streptomyces sp. NPDC020096]
MRGNGKYVAVGMAAMAVFVGGCGGRGGGASPRPSTNSPSPSSSSTAQAVPRPVFSLRPGGLAASQSIDITVRHGQLFTIAVADSGDSGYQWAVGQPAPDASVVRPAGNGHADPSHPELAGADGTTYLIYQAVGTGHTDIRLLDRFTGYMPPGQPGRPAYSAVYHVTVD